MVSGNGAEAGQDQGPGSAGSRAGARKRRSSLRSGKPDLADIVIQQSLETNIYSTFPPDAGVRPAFQCKPHGSRQEHWLLE